MKYSLTKEGQVCANNVPLFREGKHLCGTPYKREIKATPEEINLANKIQLEEFPHEVDDFSYNGFGVEDLGTKAEYKAAFKEWTNDPGIFVAKCSDGQERYIPSCQINCSFMLPKQEYKSILFGKSCDSK